MMTSDQFIVWRRLLGIRDGDDAPEVDDAILHESILARNQMRAMRYNNIRRQLGLQPDPGFAD